MNITKIILIALLVISSCQSNLNKVEADNNIKKITWTSNDEFPSVKKCNELSDPRLVNDCFRNFLSSEILKNLKISKIIIEKPLNDTVSIELLIDKKGKISISGKIIPKNIIQIISNFESILDNAIDSLPIVLPATKTTLGVSVNSKFQLPIILKSK